MIAPANYVPEGADLYVAATFDRVLRKLSAAGVEIADRPIPAFNVYKVVLAAGGIVAPETYLFTVLLVRHLPSPCIGVQVRIEPVVRFHRYVPLRCRVS